MATLTVYPDANPESTSVDGWAQRDTVVETWATIIAGAGNNSADTDANSQFVAFTPDTTAGNWILLKRAILLFDTSALTSAATISAAVLSVEGTAKLDIAGLAPTIDVYTSTPASNTAIVNADFTQTGSTSQTGSPMAYASWSTTGYNDFTFNATGIGNISKTGVSKFALRNANYDVAGASPTWGATARIQFTGYYADQAGTSSDPKLVITYTTTRIRDVIMGGGGIVVRKR